MSKTFLVGDRVTWKSQAGGSWKQKTGTVVEVVPAFKVPKDKNFGSSRNVESYIVEVSYPAKRSKSAIKKVVQRKPERYWPLARNLKLVKGGSALGTVEVNRSHSDGTVEQYHLPVAAPEPDPTPAVEVPEGRDPFLAGILDGGDAVNGSDVHLGGVLQSSDNEGASSIESVN